MILIWIAAALLFAASGASANGDTEKRSQTDVSGFGVTLFPPTHPLFDPATADQLRDDCNAQGDATVRIVGTGRVSYIGAIHNAQSHCGELDPVTGFPTGAFSNGQGTMTGAGTDADGERDRLFYEYQATFILDPALIPGPPAWCDPTQGPCPITANGQVRYTGGTGRFSRVLLSEWTTAFVFQTPDGESHVYGDGSISSNGPLPGHY
jgi:hypothetical protein